MESVWRATWRGLLAFKRGPSSSLHFRFLGSILQDIVRSLVFTPSELEMDLRVLTKECSNLTYV